MSDARKKPYTLYYEDERGALLFSEDSAPYALYAEHDGGVYVVDSGAAAGDLRALVEDAARPEPRRAPGPRIARRELRRSRRRSRAAASTGALATFAMLLAPGLGTAPASGAQRPTKVLQAVDIELGADGALRAVTSATVRRTDGETSSDKTELDPSKVVRDLPVRVLTSYVYDGRTGTNLADLRGVKGRVEVTITVQNTTVRSELVKYDAGGQPQERYALVGMPLTVTASAVLPKDSLAGVVRPAHNVRETATNGVVGKTESGDTTVQWAALLAPPRLAAAASFTLVEDATDFRLPELDLTVQPGLVTDLSVDRLVHEAFRKDGTGQLSLESKTIDLISDVNTILAGATRTLADIRRALADGADTLGSRLIGQLATSSTQLTVAAGDLSARLDGLDTGLTATLEHSRDENVESLRETVATLSDYIGHPDDAPIEALPVTPGCKIKVTGAGKDTTLYGQLKRVSRQLLTLQSATRGCTDTIKASLTATLGDPTACPPGSASVACTLDSARGRLDEVATYLASAGSALVEQFDPTAVDGVRAALTALTKKVTGVQEAAAKLGNGAGGNDADSVRGELDALSVALGGAIAQVRPGGAFADALGGLHALAEQHRAEIGADAGADTSISAQLAAAATAVCDTPGVLTLSDPDAQAYVDTLRALLVGTSCGNGANATPLPVPAGYPAPLADRLRLEYDAWSTVAALTDLDSPASTGAAKEATALGDALADLKKSVDDLRKTVGGPGDDSLNKKVDDVVTSVQALYTPPTGDGTCAPDPTVPVPALNALATAFAVLDCNQKGLGENLSALLASATPTYTTAAEDVRGAAAAANQARLDAASALDDLLGTLDGSLAEAADESLAEGAAVIRDQQRRLTDQEEEFSGRLDAATQDAVDEIGSSIAESNRLLGDSAALLERGLRAVQGDLGVGGDNPDGLLGLVSSSAGRTAAAAQDVLDASDDATKFSRVRAAELDDVFLQQAQLTRALELHAEYPPFALTLPQGSTSSVVFNFHLQGV